jgi:hypothetical protein
MLNDQEEKLRKHVGIVPCFSCLVRLSCVTFFPNGRGDVKEICDSLHDWKVKAGEITLERNLRTGIIRKETLKILRKEKLKYAKSSENR